MTNENGAAWEEGDKAFNPASLGQSVIDRPPATTTPTTPLDAQLLLLHWGNMAEEIAPWGVTTKLRDMQLRRFMTSESMFLSALGIVSSRNTAFSWTIEGAPRTAARCQEMLEYVDAGEGWQSLMTKVSIDLYTQDHGAFIEIVRQGDGPEAPVVTLNSLDAAACFHTGNPVEPVLYKDRFSRWHLLKWWQVATISEMPTPIEMLYGMQYCALSRLLLAAQIVKNIEIYEREKTGGRWNRAIHLVSGITTPQIMDAIQQYQAAADNSGLTRYINPIIAGTIDPKADVKVATLELAGYPDNFDREVMWKHYISQIAMAFLSDYQEFAPLPGGGLGTSAQSEILHMKTRGKGPGLFMKLISTAMNFKIMPSACKFEFDEQDLEAEETEAKIKKLRADERAVRIASAEISPVEARQLAVDAGDLPLELFQAAGGTDLTQNVQVTDEATQEQETGGEGQAQQGEQVVATKELTPLLRGLWGEKAARVGDFLQSRIHKIFTMSADDLYGLGYMDTAQRIQLSSFIGDLLSDLEESMGADLAGVVRRNLRDDHARLLLTALAEKQLYWGVPEYEGIPAVKAWSA